MNIAVINIKDLIKALLIIALVIIIIISGIIIVNGKEELEEEIAIIDETKDSSFLYCLGMEVPLMLKEENENSEIEENAVSLSRILGTELEMLYNIKESKNEENNENLEIEQEVEEEKKDTENSEEEKLKTIETAEKLDTKVIEENNIAPSYTDDKNNIQIKNQSKYDANEVLENSNYELKNKNKVIIYHTHTCESYTSSEKYSYEMTGAYRTTDLNYTVARVRRRTRRGTKAIWKNSRT